MNIQSKNILVFDCEIQNQVDGVNVKWTDYQKMGHAVTASFNFKTGNYKLYFEDNLHELADDLHGADMVTGFNIKGFDLPLLIKGSGLPIDLGRIRIYDMLEESRKAVRNNFAKGLRLDNHLENMFGRDGMKCGDGADAPKLWQDRKLGKLSTYVLRDVKCEAMLFEHIWNHGWVSTETYGKQNVIPPQRMFPMNTLGF